MVFELVGSILVMAIKPFSLLKLSFMAALRGAFVVVNTWVEVVSASIYLNVSIFWRIVLIITLPVRALAALHREKQLQAQLSELEDALYSLACERKELQEHIRIAIEEHEMMLGELEEEQEQAIHKIKLLEAELKDLKDENLRLKEVHGKSQWDTSTSVGKGQKHKDVKVSNIKDGSSPWKSSGKNDDASIMHRIIGRSVFLDQRREVALSQSLFSAVLSLLVGIVIWEAEEPCMPLVTALFMVVGISLKSVVQFFSTIKNKPASDAVALLSLNWFMLGTLTYPTLPRVARLLLPSLTKPLQQALDGFVSLSFLSPK